MNSDDLKVLAMAKKYTNENPPTDAQVNAAVDEYLTKNPVDSVDIDTFKSYVEGGV